MRFTVFLTRGGFGISTPNCWLGEEKDGRCEPFFNDGEWTEIMELK